MDQLIKRDTNCILHLPVNHYQIARLYGPGMPASCEEGLQQKVLDKRAGEVGVVAVHCWNLGEEDGPYPIGPDAHSPGEVADWVPTAHEIVETKIRPVLEAARQVGVTVFHLAQYVYAPRYPSYIEISKDPTLQPPSPPPPIDGCVRPRTVEDLWTDEYGEAYPGPVWLTHREMFDIAKSVRPLPGEAVFLNGWQLNGLCRRMDIDTLVYVGFMADLCLLNIPGALREMATKFHYTCIALRDCTTAYEFPETYDRKSMTHAALRLIESDLGYSSSSDDFIAACTRSSDQ